MKLFHATATIAVVSIMETLVTAVHWECLNVKFYETSVYQAAFFAWSNELNTVNNYPKRCIWEDPTGIDEQFRSFPLQATGLPWTSGTVSYYVVSNRNRSKLKVFSELRGGFLCNLKVTD
ncbi:BgtE-5901 [Blumeria graminis f. sp. tritici]|uniref:BgtE-5901 n=2 Tax=Blumeria graminis f. sp. tritici TaxID=62690 RepID=A0A9X9LBN0_BLUGR|nr:BgtE-5901 [Blumeria graminis f. sp. tritici]